MRKPPEPEGPEGFTPSTTEGATATADHIVSPDTAAVSHSWNIVDGSVIDTMPDEVYHADPLRPDRSLSHSGLRVILDVPARFVHQRDHGRPHRRAFDVGHAAHGEVLGTGLDIVVIDAKDYKSRAAQAERDAIRAAGKVPLLRWEMDHVRGMAAALRRHPVAGRLFRPGAGTTERSMFWRDDRFGFWRRGRTDWSMFLPDGRYAMIDYKSTSSAEPYAVSKHAFDFGYYTQDVYYRQAAVACGLADDEDDTAFLFVFQEKEPPYIVTVVEIDEAARATGRAMVNAGLELYARCLELDEWPDYSPGDILPVTLPKYADYAVERTWDHAARLLRTLAH
jgi:hypothetical protein